MWPGAGRIPAASFLISKQAARGNQASLVTTMQRNPKRQAHAKVDKSRAIGNTGYQE